LYRHSAGSSAPDTLVYEEPDEKFEVEAYKTLSNEYIFLVSGSHTTTEARYISAKQPDAEWKILEPRKQGVEYYPDHNADSFYIRVNDTGRNFRLVTAPVGDPGSANWHEVMAQNPAIMLDEMQLFRNFCVLFEREGGLPQIRVIDLRSGQSKRIAFPEPAYAAYSYTNRVYDTTDFRYGYQSPITPASVFSYDMEKGSSTLLKQKEVPGGYDRNKYQVEQIYAVASDGVKIPVSVLHLKGAKLDGTGPLYLYGYGSQHGRSRSGGGSGSYSRGRRDGQSLARCRAHDEEKNYIHRLHRLRGRSGQAWVWVERSACHRGAQRRRAADGRCA
jgi:oligopeptidase B